MQLQASMDLYNALNANNTLTLNNSCGAGFTEAPEQAIIDVVPSAFTDRQNPTSLSPWADQRPRSPVSIARFRRHLGARGKVSERRRPCPRMRQPFR
jgi:hypothetical protein